MELHVRGYIATNVNLQGTRQWHPSADLLSWCVAEIVRLHGTSPWHLIVVFSLGATFLVCMYDGAYVLTVECGGNSIRVATVNNLE